MYRGVARGEAGGPEPPGFKKLSTPLNCKQMPTLSKHTNFYYPLQIWQDKKNNFFFDYLHLNRCVYGLTIKMSIWTNNCVV